MRLHRPQLRHDESGAPWFFQNGPQRVYVELEAAPMVWRPPPDLEVAATPARRPVPDTACSTRRAGSTSPPTSASGLVHTQDVGLAAEAIEQGRWQPTTAERADLPARLAT